MLEKAIRLSIEHQLWHTSCKVVVVCARMKQAVVKVRAEKFGLSFNGQTIGVAVR